MKERFLNHAKFNTHTLVTMAIMIALTCVSTYIPAVQITGDLAVSYQSFFAVVNGLVLGAVWGAVAQLIYVFMGLVGLPVFTRGGSGFAYVLKPSFGFLIGFIFAAFVTGLLAECFKSEKPWYMLLAAFIGTIVIYPFGIGYMYMAQVVYLGIAPSVALATLSTMPFFFLGDCICLVLVAFIPWKMIRKMSFHVSGMCRRGKIAPLAADNESDAYLLNSKDCVAETCKEVNTAHAAGTETDAINKSEKFDNR